MLGEEEVKRMKTTYVLVTALSFLALLVMAPVADARRGRDDGPRPPKCQIEDGGVKVCR